MMNLNTRVESSSRIRVGKGQGRTVRAPRITRTRREAVEIEEKRFGYFPRRFRWHGKSYNVEAVERCWTKSRGRPVLGFRVRCAEGLFDLLQDVNANLWELSVVS